MSAFAAIYFDEGDLLYPVEGINVLGGETQTLFIKFIPYNNKTKVWQGKHMVVLERMTKIHSVSPWSFTNRYSESKRSLRGSY